MHPKFYFAAIKGVDIHLYNCRALHLTESERKKEEILSLHFLALQDSDEGRGCGRSYYSTPTHNMEQESSPETSPSLSPKNGVSIMAGEMDEAYKSSILSLPNLKLMECHGQIRELQTIIRNK